MNKSKYNKAYEEGFNAAINILEKYKEEPMVDDYVVNECIIKLKQYFDNINMYKEI